MARLPRKGAATQPAHVFDKLIDTPERGPASTAAAVTVRVRVVVDTLVSRPDLGLNVTTFVAVGDAIPLGIEGYPRTPA